MELHQVKAFVTVARIGNLTRAAQVLCVTQPAVTAQIKSLESSLGVALFERQSGRMALTREGEQLLSRAEQFLAVAGELQGMARQMQGQTRGLVQLGIPGEAPAFLRIGELSAAVQRDLPLVELSIHTHVTGNLLDRLHGGSLTAALLIASHPPRDLHWQALRSVVYRVAVPQHLAPQVLQGGWRTLAALPWVDGALETHTHLMLRHLFEQQGLTPQVILRTEDTAALDALVAKGAGCALLREDIALPGAERGDWMVWGHARVDAQLFYCTAHESTSDPLVVALSAVLASVWQP